ncbi:MAG: signal transduction histidine kinase [Candidatus Krumholzibacteriia bacterium]|jgi:signal transduction histidine kinase
MFEDLYCVLPEEILLSHVLLGGDEQQVTTMHALLTQWGVTASRLASLDAVPTVLDCDAVILQGDFLQYRETNLGSLSDGTGGAVGPAAPLIFINAHAGEASTVPANWQVMNQTKSDGAALQAALWSAFGLAESLRGALDNESYLQFLGHEMRSPLTALKTSLDELAQVMHKSSDDELKMLAIARRNVQRLHETVEWNQEMLSANAAAESVNFRTSSIASLARYLAEADHDICMSSRVTETTLETDYNLVDKLLCQMTRVLNLVCPGTELDVQLFHGEGTGDGICLKVSPETPRAVSASIVRQRNLVALGEPKAVTAELERLTHIVVADCLVAAIGAELKTVHTENEAPALVLTLPVGPNPSFR